MVTALSEAHTRGRWLASVAMVCGAALFGMAAMSAQKKGDVASRWRDRDVAIDGINTEWEGRLTPLVNPPLVVGCINDGTYLYVAIGASESRVRAQILGLGLTVWFDPEGGTRKAFGITFPVGQPQTAAGRGPSGPATSRQKKPPDDVEVVDRLEILGPGKGDRRTLVIDQVPGIEVSIGQKEGGVFYELRVPLARTADHPYAIGAAPGAAIGIGMVTPDRERGVIPSGGQPRAGFGGPGGMSGGGGRGGPPSGMGRGGFEPAKPMKSWMTVRLAAPPAV
jgi:hypothetical protein